MNKDSEMYRFHERNIDDGRDYDCNSLKTVECYRSK